MEDNEPHGICVEDPRLARGEDARHLDVERELEDPRLAQGEEAHQLDVERELDKLGSRVLTTLDESGERISRRSQ